MPKLSLSLSKNEKRLLGILFVCLFVAGYYYYIYNGQAEKVQQLETMLNEKTIEYDNLLVRAKERFKYEKAIEDYNAAIKILAPKFYGDLSQEKFMLITHDLASESELDVSNYTFSYDESTLGDYLSLMTNGGNMSEEQRSEMTAGLNVSQDFFLDTVKNRTVNLNFTGDYEKLRNFLMRLNEEDKYIYIDNINLTADENQQLNGSMSLQVFNIPSLDETISDYYANNYFTQASTREVYENIFEPYQYYKEVTAKERAKKLNTSTSTSVSVADSGVPPVPSYIGVPSFEQKTKEMEAASKFTVLTSFDQLDCYFVPNSTEIEGSVAKSAASEDGRALRLSYQFVDFNRQNEASVVFREKTIMQDMPVSSLGIEVNSEIINNNLLKATLVAADGKNYDIEFVGEMTEGWTKFVADIPADIKYPFMVRRIYLQSVDKQQKLEGSILFDNLSAIE